MFGIVGGIIAAVSALASAGIQAHQTAKAREESRELAGIRRQDELSAQAAERLLAKQTIDQRQREFGLQLGFQKREAALGREEREEQTAYNRFRSQLNQFNSMLNQDRNLKQRIFQTRPYRGAARLGYPTLG